jgi:hypothetical protein
MFNNPGNAPFRDYSPGPHAGTPTDPDAHSVSDPLDGRLWRLVRGRSGAWIALVVICLVVALGAYLSLS